MTRIKDQSAESDKPLCEAHAGTSASTDDAADIERRAILDAIGKFAAFTPPMMMTLLLSDRASAASRLTSPPTSPTIGPF